MAVAFFSVTSNQLFCNSCSCSATFTTMSISLHLKHSFFDIHDTTLLDFLIPSRLPHLSLVLDGGIWQDLMAPGQSDLLPQLYHVQLFHFASSDDARLHIDLSN